MNRAGVFLALLLLVQLAVVGYQYWGDEYGNEALAAQRIVDVGAYIVDEIRLEDSEGSAALLRRRGKHWELPGLNRLPADARRIEKLLEQLTAADPGWPVAHTVAARQRFQVAPYLFRRKVTLAAQNRELGSVFLGTSPGFRQLHARAENADAIYSINLNLFDLPAQESGWLDPGLLQVRAALRITADGYSLDRQSGQWRLGSGATPDERELQALLQVLKNLRVQGIAAPAATAAARPENADLILQIEGLRGERTLEFYRLDNQYFVRSSNYPYLFRISAYEFDKLAGIDSMLLTGAQ